MIDNSKYYNDCLAYDFEMFAERPKKKQNPTSDNIIKIKSKKRYNITTKNNVFKIPAICFALSFCFVNIQMRILINETNSNINQVKSEIRELQAEKTALEMKLEKEISLDNLERSALEMGMCKPNKRQINYIRVYDKNRAISENGKEIE